MKNSGLNVEISDMCFSYETQSSGTIKSLLTSSHLKKSKEQLIFNHLCLDINKGERVALKGGNGAGKSTLLMIVMGLLTPTAGSVLTCASKRALFSDSDFIFQDVSVGQYIDHHLKWSYGRSCRDDISGILDIAELDKSIKRQKIQTLSYGMKKRLLFALNVYKKTNLLILDEVFTSISSSYLSRAKSHVEKCLGDKGTLILADHRQEVVNLFCHREIKL